LLFTLIADVSRLEHGVWRRLASRIVKHFPALVGDAKVAVFKRKPVSGDAA
jgi:hypothetical protein